MIPRNSWIISSIALLVLIATVTLCRSPSILISQIYLVLLTVVISRKITSIYIPILMLITGLILVLSSDNGQHSITQAAIILQLLLTIMMVVTCITKDCGSWYTSACIAIYGCLLLWVNVSL